MFVARIVSSPLIVGRFGRLADNTFTAGVDVPVLACTGTEAFGPGASECLGVLPRFEDRGARITFIGLERRPHRSCCAEFSSAVWLNPIIHRSHGFSNFSHTQQRQLLPSPCEERVGPSTTTSLVCSFAAWMVESDRCTESGQNLSVYSVDVMART